MELRLSGTAVIVTGASGGIGQATARLFAAEGARVLCHYHRDRAGAERLAAEIDGRACRADLRRPGAADMVVAHALEVFGRVDACVANAGVYPQVPVPVRAMSLERWRETLDANLTATFLTARAYLAHAAEAGGGGSLVLVGSTAGTFGEEGHADYAAAKSAIMAGLLLSLKNEVVRDSPSIRVNAVAPGWTVTPMAIASLTPENVARATSTMALRKVAEPEDVARAIVFLTSPTAAGHVTGQTVTVAGGMEGRLLHDPSDPLAR